jgi:hypothetical protein
MKSLLLGLLSVGLEAQVFSFSPQTSVPKTILTEWLIEVSGAKPNSQISIQEIVQATVGHISYISPDVAQQIVTAAAGKTSWAYATQICTDAGIGTTVGAYIKSQANFSSNKLAQDIAAGGVTLAGICGLAIPTFKSANPPPYALPNLITSFLITDANGNGAGYIFAHAGPQTAFKEVQ